MTEVRKTWYSKCCYQGKRPIFFGTVVADSYEHALIKLQELWTTISPHPMPDEMTPMMGQIIVVPYGEDR